MNPLKPASSCSLIVLLILLLEQCSEQHAVLRIRREFRFVFCDDGRFVLCALHGKIVRTSRRGALSALAEPEKAGGARKQWA